jgi:hypothetical protein
VKTSSSASISILSLVLSVSVLACAGTKDPAGGGGNGSGSGGRASGGGTGGGTGSGTGGRASGGPGGTGGGIVGNPDADVCGLEKFDLERKPAELMLVLDRSASMQDPAEGSTATTPKWDLVVPAVNQVITETNTSLSWGMKVYPERPPGATTEPAECTPTGVTNRIDVPMAANNAATVTGAVTATRPDGNGTPTGAAIDAAVTYLKSLTTDNKKYILLATDGEPSCYGTVNALGKDSTQARTYAVQAVGAAATAGFHTFVVGVATSKASATSVLNMMAMAGLEARPDPNPLATKYYLANTKDELVSALKVITGQISNCIFPLKRPPPVPENIAVKVSGTKAPQDPTHQDGWDYTGPDYTGVIVYGSWCEMIKTSAANMVEITYGCPGIVIP